MSIRLRYLLIGLALIFGQGLSLAHALDHSALNLQDHSCQICSHGQPDNTAAANSITPLALASYASDTVAVVATTVARAPIQRPPIRGPPSSFL